MLVSFSGIETNMLATVVSTKALMLSQLCKRSGTNYQLDKVAGLSISPDESVDGGENSWVIGEPYPKHSSQNSYLFRTIPFSL